MRFDRSALASASFSGRPSTVVSTSLILSPRYLPYMPRPSMGRFGKIKMEPGAAIAAPGYQ